MPTVERATHRRRTSGPAAMLAMATILAGGSVMVGASETHAVDLTGRISTARNSQIAFEKAMRSADKSIKRLKRQQKAAKRKIKKSERRLARVKERRGVIGDRLADAREELRVALIADALPAPEPEPLTLEIASTTTLAFETGSSDETAFLLDDDSLAAEVAPVVSTTTASAAVTALRADVKKARKADRRIAKKLRKVQRKKQNRKRREASLHRQRRAMIGVRERNERALGGWIKAMTSLAKRRAVIKGKKKPAMRGRSWSRPSPNGITQGYHRGHDGIDYGGWNGAPIRAAAAGVVAYVGWNPWDKKKRAFVVVLGHATGYETIYGHLLPIRRVRVGEEVRRGQLIGVDGQHRPQHRAAPPLRGQPWLAHDQPRLGPLTLPADQVRGSPDEPPGRGAGPLRRFGG